MDKFSTINIQQKPGFKITAVLKYLNKSPICECKGLSVWPIKVFTCRQHQVGRKMQMV